MKLSTQPTPTVKSVGSYDAAGRLAVQTSPLMATGVSQTWAYDTAGQVASMTVSEGATTWLSDTVARTTTGQISSEANSATGQSVEYGYDVQGRLVRVDSRTVDGCERRDYGFDANSNRTSLTSFVRAGDSNCGAGSQQSSVVSLFTASDQMLSSSDGAAGLSYDDLGRVTTLPAGLSPAAADVTLDYYAINLVHAVSNTATNVTDTYSLDTAQRVACVRTAASGSSDSASCGATTTSTDVTSHFVDESSDSPSWTITKTAAGSTTTFNATDLTGGLVATISGTTITQHVADLRGNITLTATTGLANATITSYDEYGNTTTDPKTRPANAWHGQQQRTTNSTTGLIQMGVRLYNSITGLFLQQDPVHGGNPNTYTHPVDPINSMDLTGEINFGKWWSDHGDATKTLLSAATLLGCGICGLASGVISALEFIDSASKVGIMGAVQKHGADIALGVIGFGVGRTFKRSVAALARTDAKILRNGRTAGRNSNQVRSRSAQLRRQRYQRHNQVLLSTASVSAVQAADFIHNYSDWASR